MAGEDPTRLALDLVKQSLYAYFRCLSRSRAAVCLDSSGIYRWRTSVPHAWLNGVLCSIPAGADSAGVVDDVMKDLRSHDVSTFSWWFAEDGLAEGWLDILRRRGFRTERSTPGMAVQLDRLTLCMQLPDLTIVQAVDGRCMRDWVKTIVLGFGLPESWADPILALHGDLARLPTMRHYRVHRRRAGRDFLSSCRGRRCLAAVPGRGARRPQWGRWCCSGLGRPYGWS